MELGNMIFGNSRGKYSLARSVGYEEELGRLFNAYTPGRDNSRREYGEEFENEIFSVFPYYWGECSCGFDEAGNFNEKHLDTCYQTKLKQEQIKNGWQYDGEWLGAPENLSYQERRKVEDEIYKRLTREFNLPMRGCAIHCTCDYGVRYQTYLESIGYSDGHKESCLLVKPNFLYKPSGLTIKWYKYPLRDSYTNKRINLSQFRKIIDECVISVAKGVK